MTPEKFYVWLKQQEEPEYELVDDEPCYACGRMPDWSAEKVANLSRELARQIHGGPFRLRNGRTFIATPNGNRRLTDLSIDRDDFKQTLRESPNPIALFEVVQTLYFENLKKIEEFKTIKTLQAMLFLHPDLIEVLEWRRNAQGDWVCKNYKGSKAVVEFPEINASINLLEIYKSHTVDLVLEDMKDRLRNRGDQHILDRLKDRFW